MVLIFKTIVEPKICKTEMKTEVETTKIKSGNQNRD